MLDRTAKRCHPGLLPEGKADSNVVTLQIQEMDGKTIRSLYEHQGQRISSPYRATLPQVIPSRGWGQPVLHGTFGMKT